MTVASLELCKELHELSGWECFPYYWSMRSVGNFESVRTTVSEQSPKLRRRLKDHVQYPAYGLGFLLDKLPTTVEVRNHYTDESFGVIARGGWANDMMNRISSLGNTPEDAACKLAIELFKAGVLEKAS